MKKELDNYETLHLSKEEMLKIVDNSEEKIFDSDVLSKSKKLKLKIGLSGLRMLIGMTDEETLNVIWNEIIKFTDNLRYVNAKSSDSSLFDTLNKLKD